MVVELIMLMMNLVGMVVLTYPVELDLLWLSDTKIIGLALQLFLMMTKWACMLLTQFSMIGQEAIVGCSIQEAYEDGYIVMGEEVKVIDEVNDLVGGDDTGSFNTSPYISCTPEGICCRSSWFILGR